MPRKKQYEVEEVVDKAMNTFWINGYDGTSVRMLEKEMGINQFSIYSSFGSKQDLFIAVLKRYKGYVTNTFLKRLITSEGKISDVNRFLTDFAYTIQSGKYNGCLMVNTSLEVDKREGEVFTELTQYFDFIKSTFYDALSKAQDRGELHRATDIDMQASYLLGTLQGLSVFAKFSTKKEIDNFISNTINTIK